MLAGVVINVVTVLIARGSCDRLPQTRGLEQHTFVSLQFGG